MRYQLRYIRVPRARSSPVAIHDDSPRTSTDTNPLLAGLFGAATIEVSGNSRSVARTTAPGLVSVPEYRRVRWLCGRYPEIRHWLTRGFRSKSLIVLVFDVVRHPVS